MNIDTQHCPHCGAKMVNRVEYGSFKPPGESWLTIGWKCPECGIKLTLEGPEKNLKKSIKTNRREYDGKHV